MPKTKSYWGIVNTANGKIENGYELDRSIFFGEGIAILRDTLFQLTYKNRKGFVSAHSSPIKSMGRNELTITAVAISLHMSRLTSWLVLSPNIRLPV